MGNRPGKCCCSKNEDPKELEPQGGKKVRPIAKKQYIMIEEEP